MIVDQRTRLTEAVLTRERMSPSEHALHQHYASNALATGHDDRCAKVRRPRNWPTIVGRVPCTCGHSADANARLLALQRGTFPAGA